MRFIGIDLAWTYKNETGVCVINDSGEIEYLSSAVLSDEDLLSIIKNCSHEPVCIAIDAPLVVNNESGSREAERDFMRTKIHGNNLSLFVASRGYLTRTFGQIRGETLMNLIKKEIPSIIVSETYIEGKSTIVETFPSGICCGLFPDIYPVKYKIKRKVAYEETQYQMNRILGRFKFIEENERFISGLVSEFDIDNLVVDKNNHKHVEDKVDAFLSAYGLYSIYKGISTQKTFGNVKDGFITIPIVKNTDSLFDYKSPKFESVDSNQKLENVDVIHLTTYLGELAKSLDADSDEQLKAFSKLDREVNRIKNKCFKNL